MPATLSVDKSLTLARQAAKKQDWVTAVDLNRSVLERFPGNKKAAKAIADMRVAAAQGLLKAAAAAEQKEDWAAASQQFEAAHFLLPNHRAIAGALTNSYLESDAPLRALKTCEPLTSAHPDDAEVFILMGRALHQLDRAEEAVTALNRALELAPGNATIHRLLGVVAQSGGDLDAALVHFEAGLEVAPGDINLLRHISIVKRDVPSDDPHIAQMRQALAKLGSDNPGSALLHFALFDMLHRCSEHAAAFRHLQKGNMLIAEKHPFDFKSEAVVGAFSKALFPEPMPPSETSEATRFIFVTGLPRSGTTLTERILARDANVQACGELEIVRSAVFEQLRAIQNADKKALKSEHIQALRERLLQGFSEISDGRPITVDKMPMNFRWIGYICAALPEAKIVHMNRDPQAVAWSLYRQAFRGRGQDFIYTPEDIARFMVFHRDLMQHWRKICGDRIYDLNYSDLVNDQKGETQALAKALGLKWSEDWMTPEKATNHVRTASVVQVTEPVYKNSDESWKTYEAALAPMNKALVSAGLI